MNNKIKKGMGHVMALFTVFVWGITFVSSRIVLEYFTPLALMSIRFTIAYIALWITYPKRSSSKSIKEELIYLGAGFTGVTGYFFLENSALMYTTVSNVGLILASAPLFVAIVLHIFGDSERFQCRFLYGFIIAIAGIAVIIYNGQSNLAVNPLGDFMALMAGVFWAFYSLFQKQMDQSLSTIVVIRKTFFYGALSGNAFLFFFEGGTEYHLFFMYDNWIHILGLGLIASSACYAFWNKAIKTIGAVRTSSYIYLIPFFTMTASAVVLDEKITGLMIIGSTLILLGVYISEHGISVKRKVVEVNSKETWKDEGEQSKF